MAKKITTTVPPQGGRTPQEHMFALRYVAVAVLVAFAIGFIIGIVAHAKFYPCVVVPTISVQRDTITRTDTIKGKIVPPVIRERIRRDTLILPSKPDTSDAARDTSPQAYVLPSGGISVPIAQNKYSTSDYTAWVSGWHAALDSIKIYPKTTTITETITKLAQPPRKWLTLTVGPSVVYCADKQIRPGAAITLGINIKSW